MPAELPPGHFRLIPFAEPPVPAGAYLLSGEVAGLPGSVEPLQSRVRIESPRYSLPPDQILSTFPPAGARGAFTSRLPQIVLRRRTLPWERSFDLGIDDARPPTPWLSLVLIAEGEGQLLSDVPVADCTSVGVDLGDDRDVTKGNCLEVPLKVVEKVFPTQADLPLLCHVRQVDLADTELALNDDDGYLAVVMCNRLPQPGVRYMACLVNLEEQFDALPEIPVEDSVFEYAFAERVVNLAAMVQAPAQGERSFDSVAMGIESVQLAAQGDDGPPFVAAAKGPQAAILSGWAPVSGPAGEADDQAYAVKASASMIEGFANYGILKVAAKRFPVLATWSFTCEERGDFEYLASHISVRMLGHVTDGDEAPDGDPLGDQPPPMPAQTSQPGTTRPLPLVTATGHVQLDHLGRRGDGTPAWYRGPLVPAPVPRAGPADKPPLAHHADQLRRVVPDGQEDLGHAAAFEIGRLLALSQPGVVAALQRWRQDAFGAARVAELEKQAAAALPPEVADAAGLSDPLATGAAADPGVAPHTAGARSLRAVVAALGAEDAILPGGSRSTADPGVAAELLKEYADGGQAGVLKALGLDAVGLDPGLEGADLVAGLRTTAAPVAEGVTADIEVALLREHLETVVADLVDAGAAHQDVLDRILRGIPEDRIQ